MNGAGARRRRHRPAPTAVDGRLALAIVIVATSAWTWYCIGRGWYLQADFSNLADAHHARLGWSYLSAPIGGHFGPTGRLLYWLLDRLVPMDYPVTVALRVGLQAAVGVLLYRVLRRLNASAGLATALVLLVSVNPILLVSLAWLSGGLTLPIGELLVLAAIDRHLARRHTGSIKPAALAGVLLTLAVFSYDGAVIMAVVLPVLSIGCLVEGSFVQRCRAVARDWPGWLATVLPLAVGVVISLQLADAQGARSLSVFRLWTVVGDAWSRLVAPSLIGGPWRWFAGSSYVPFAAPTDAVRLIAEAAVVLVLLAGIRQAGWNLLTGVAVVAVVTIGQIAFAGVGRYGSLGQLVTITPRYASLVPLAVALGIGAALAQSNRQAPIVDPVDGPGDVPLTERRALLAALLAVLVASSVVSAVRFTTIWSDSPARSYTENLARSARAAGPQVNIYDTAVRPDVIAGVEPRHHVSDLLALQRVPARFDDPSSEPLVARRDGTLTPSVFVVAATATGMTEPKCGTYLAGQGTWTLPLDKSVTPAEWFVRLDYYQPAGTPISVVIVNQDGSTSVPTEGARHPLGPLGSLVLRLPVTHPVAIRLTTFAASTSLCVGRAAIGAPFPAS